MNCNKNSNLLKCLTVVMCIFTVAYLGAENHVRYIPRNGDALFNVFKKYKIPTNASCVTYFKEINKVKKIDKLLIGKPYSLPILKYRYNGKSVASSVPELYPNLTSKVIQYNQYTYTKQYN